MRELVNSHLLCWAHAKSSWNTQCLWFCDVKAGIYFKISWDSPSSNNVLSIEGQPRIPRPRTRPTWTSNIWKIYSRRSCLLAQTYSTILLFLSTGKMRLCLVSLYLKVARVQCSQISDIVRTIKLTNAVLFTAIRGPRTCTLINDTDARKGVWWLI